MTEFTIISIDESRLPKKEWIRAAVGWKEIDIAFVNGKDPKQLLAAKNKWNKVATPGPYKAGEFGIFYSVLNCLEYGAANDGILYFEDDAVPTIDFQPRFDKYVSELPKSADMMAVWSPENQQHDYMNVLSYNNVGEPIGGEHGRSIFDFGNPELCRLWQGYGNVAMYFTRRGCKRMLAYIEKHGFFSPIDCLICIAVHGGYLNGYALKPDQPILINYDWALETTIHKSKWGSIEELTKENIDE